MAMVGVDEDEGQEWEERRERRREGGEGEARVLGGGPAPAA